jgi:hypothetical protein
MNLLSAPMYKIEDRVTIIERVLQALLADPNCKYIFRVKEFTPDEQSNWDARQEMVRARNEYSRPHAEPDSAPVSEGI